MSARKTNVILAFALAFVGGCGVQGHWTMKQVRPAVGNEGFTLARASFYPDESFEAVAIRNGETVKAKGTYDYCCCRNELTLHMGDETRVYKAYRKSCVRLHLTETAPTGEGVTVVMKKTDRCDRDPDCRESSSCGCH